MGMQSTLRERFGLAQEWQETPRDPLDTIQPLARPVPPCWVLVLSCGECGCQEVLPLLYASPGAAELARLDLPFGERLDALTLTEAVNRGLVGNRLAFHFGLSSLDPFEVA